VNADAPRHFTAHLDVQHERVGNVMHGRGRVQPGLCIPGTTHPRTGVLAMYIDHCGGILASELGESPVPTLDLSVHVFRAPQSTELTFESRPLRVGRRLIVVETWVRAAGDPEAFAVGVQTHLSSNGSANDKGALERRREQLAQPVAVLDEPLGDRAGMVIRAPGVAEMPIHPFVMNNLGILHGGSIGLLVDLACESVLGDDDHVVTGLDLRYLNAAKVGPVRVVARTLRTDEAGTHLWAEMTDPGHHDRLCVHALATTARLPAS
jgi:acyl-coenzyme A thioesterase PaaI-like protein